MVARVDPRNHPARGLEAGQVSRLVLEAASRYQIDLGIEPDRPIHQAGHGRQLQAHEMLAGEKADQVRRREDGLTADELHRPTIAPGRAT